VQQSDPPSNIVTEQELRSYLETFVSVLRETAYRYLPEQTRSLLLHFHHLPARITAYISDSYGIGYEFVLGTQTTVGVIRVQERVEDALLRAPSALSGLPTCVLCKGKSFIGNCEFGGVFPVRLSGEQAYATLMDLDIKGRNVTPGTVDRYGRSLGGKIIMGWPNANIEEKALFNFTDDAMFGLRIQLSPKLFEHYKPILHVLQRWERHIVLAEMYGDRRSETWTQLRAMERAKDEVIAAVVEDNKAREENISLPQYIDSHKQKTVLVLGDYDTEGMRRLEAIKTVLRGMGYNPLLVKDVPDHFQHDLPQKVVLLGSLARFVVVDDSSKSGHLLEVQLCKTNDFYTVLLRAGGKVASYMTAGASEFSKVLIEQEYDPTNPARGITEGIQRVESAIAQTSAGLARIYPWRKFRSL
jgi:hypothetical protein